MPGDFRLPGGDSRTVFIGATGSGKTTGAAWLLSHANFEARPWVLVDFKGEPTFDDIGAPPIQGLGLGSMPGKRGLYRIEPRPDQDDELETWLWSIWERGNVGLFIDEAALLPRQSAWKAILRQGRSKRIPVIACTQRPVGVDRETFSEAGYFAVFGRMTYPDDQKLVSLFLGGRREIDEPLPRHHFWWFDVAQQLLMRLRPVPEPDTIVSRIRDRAPRRFWLG